jgi:hypothetical protein
MTLLYKDNIIDIFNNCEQKMADGHKSRKVFDEKDIDMVLNILKEGGSIISVAAALHISREMIYKWKERDEVFRETIQKGIVYSEAWWQNQGKGSLRDKDFNCVLWYMNMRNRFGWCDTKPQYPRKKIKGFKGSLADKNKALDKALEKGVISTDEHNVVQNSLLAEAKVLEIDQLAKRVENLEAFNIAQKQRLVKADIKKEGNNNAEKR